MRADGRGPRGRPRLLRRARRQPRLLVAHLVMGIAPDHWPRCSAGGSSPISGGGRSSGPSPASRCSAWRPRRSSSASLPPEQRRRDGVADTLRVCLSLLRDRRFMVHALGGEPDVGRFVRLRRRVAARVHRAVRRAAEPLRPVLRHERGRADHRVAGERRALSHRVDPRVLLRVALVVAATAGDARLHRHHRRAAGSPASSCRCSCSSARSASPARPPPPWRWPPRRDGRLRRGGCSAASSSSSAVPAAPSPASSTTTPPARWRSRSPRVRARPCSSTCCSRARPATTEIRTKPPPALTRGRATRTGSVTCSSVLQRRLARRQGHDSACDFE